MTEVFHDTSRIPYTEERISNFIEAHPGDLADDNCPEVTLCIRKYPKRYFLSVEVNEFLNLLYDPVDGDDANRWYIPPKVYLLPERFEHKTFEQRREKILSEIKLKLQQRYLKSIE